MHVRIASGAKEEVENHARQNATRSNRRSKSPAKDRRKSLGRQLSRVFLGGTRRT